MFAGVECRGGLLEQVRSTFVGEPAPAADRAQVRGGRAGRGGAPVGEEQRSVRAAGDQAWEQSGGASLPVRPPHDIALGGDAAAPVVQVQVGDVEGEDGVGAGCGFIQ